MTYSVLSSTAKLGIASEDTASGYKAPSFTIPFTAGTKFSDHITQLRDNTVRASDADLQNVVQGHYWSDMTISTQGYADWAGWMFRAMIGPDTFTPGTVTTFAAETAVAATSVSLAAAPPPGSVLMLGTGASLEYAQAGTPSGSGPYMVPVTSPLLYAHNPGDPAQSQASHVFQQDRTPATVWPSYSLTTDDGVEPLGWPGCTLGALGIRLDASGWMGFTATYAGFPPVTTATFAEAESAVQAAAGWAWQVTTAGGASTRGISAGLKLTRVLDVIRACGGQAPLAVATGPMRAAASYKAIFDTAADLSLYRQAIQEPAVHTVAQPALQGGASIAVTMGRSAWTSGAVSLEESYVTADFTLSGVANTTDSPSSAVASVALGNFVQAAYT